jgi:hypothetical protein
MLLLDEGSKGNKKGQALLNMSLASRVVPPGIEPRQLSFQPVSWNQVNQLY